MFTGQVNPAPTISPISLHHTLGQYKQVICKIVYTMAKKDFHHA